ELNSSLELSALVKLSEGESIAYFVLPTVLADNDRAGAVVRSIDDHNADVGAYAERLSELIGEPESERVISAGLWHDAGKARDRWKREIKNVGLDGNIFEPRLAKRGGNYFNWRLRGGYRHEFGSLFDFGEGDDLTAHLIASHHGYARPSITSR